MYGGNFKSKNITVYGNATIVKQTGPKLVHSAEPRKAWEMMTIVRSRYLEVRGAIRRWSVDYAPCRYRPLWSVKYTRLEVIAYCGL